MLNRQVNGNGYTLIELMIAMTIVGILATIIVSSYHDNILRSNRTDAKAALVRFAQAMETHYVSKNQYCDAGGTGGVDNCGGSANDTGSPTIFPSKSPFESSETYYNLTIGFVSPTTYVLKAVPTGEQLRDKCGSLTLTQKGVKGIAGETNGTTVADCW
jgi:type IV pilus assembly protein PilE